MKFLNIMRKRNVTTHYSKWDRVDNGSGKMINNPGSSYNRIEKRVKYKTAVTWKKLQNINILHGKMKQKVYQI